MNTLAALAALAQLTDTLAHLAANASAISALLAKAKSEGREDFTPDEWAVITGADDAARAVLAGVIARALRVPA